MVVSDLFPSPMATHDIQTGASVVRVRNGAARIVRSTADCSGGLRIICRGYFEAQAVLAREEAKLAKANEKMARLRAQIQIALARQERKAKGTADRRKPCIGGGKILTDNEGNIVGAQACHCEQCRAHRSNMVDRLSRKYAKSVSFEYCPQVSLQFPAAQPDKKNVEPSPKLSFSVIGGTAGDKARAMIAQGINPLLAYLG